MSKLYYPVQEFVENHSFFPNFSWASFYPESKMEVDKGRGSSQPRDDVGVAYGKKR